MFLYFRHPACIIPCLVPIIGCKYGQILIARRRLEGGGEEVAGVYCSIARSIQLVILLQCMNRRCVLHWQGEAIRLGDELERLKSAAAESSTTVAKYDTDLRAAKAQCQTLLEQALTVQVKQKESP